MSNYSVESNGIYVKIPKYGENSYQMVLSKEAFVMAFNKWVKPQIDSKDIADACNFYYQQGKNHGIDDFVTWLYEEHKMDLSEYVSWFKEQVND